MKRIAVGILVASSVVVGFLTVTEVPVVMAAPEGCSATHQGRTGVVTCNRGRGEFRAKVTCAFEPDKYSPWVPTPGTAAASCRFKDATGVTAELRGL